MSEAQSTTLEEQIASFDPSNPEALAALEKMAMGVPAEEDPAEEVQTEEAAKQDEKTAEQAEDATSGTPQTKGVQAKDGQHIIPYSVLERERDRATRAEQTAQALADQLKQLQAGKAPTEGSEAGQLTDEDLSQLDQDLPGVSKLIRAQMKMIEGLTGTVQTLQREQEVQTQARQHSVQDEIEVAIAANPDLANWREAMTRAENPDPLMWNRAADLDNHLKQDPAWKDRPINERFAKVAESIKAIYGDQSPAPTQQTKPDPQPDLKKVADAKLKAMPAAVPNTLSDIPGGAPPNQSDIENLEGASTVALGNKFLSMTPAQIESYLARMTA